jgi:tRNA(fMet)-specific endonuclease VapC
MNATGSVLLDTSVVIDYLRQQDQPLIRQMEGTHELYLPLTALGELLYGAYKSKNKEQTLQDVYKFLQVCSLLTPDETTADWYGQVKAALAKAGTPIPQNDIWIAAMALEHNLPLVTRDAHFSKVPDLSVLNW